jgi:hypothetical protein
VMVRPRFDVAAERCLLDDLNFRKRKNHPSALR